MLDEHYMHNEDFLASDTSSTLYVQSGPFPAGESKLGHAVESGYLGKTYCETSLHIDLHDLIATVQVQIHSLPGCRATPLR